MAETWLAGMHWSYSTRAWCGLAQVLPDGRVFLRYEQTFLRVTPEDAAAELLAFWKDRRLQVQAVFAQPKLWPAVKEAGEHIAETFMRAGLPMVKANDNRVMGWSRLRSWLVPREWAQPPQGSRGLPHTITSPTLIIHPDCAKLIRALPTLIEDDHHPDDIADSPDVIPAHGLRYLAMARPAAPWLDAPPLPPNAIGHVIEELRREAARA